MNYDQIKRNFEYQVQAMHKDLLRWAERDDASQAAIDIRTKQLNAIIEYFNMMEARLSEQQLFNTELSLKRGQYHTRLQKLVYWCRLHKVSVYAPDHYTEDELAGLLEDGYDFSGPFEIAGEEMQKVVDKYYLVKSFYGPFSNQEAEAKYYGRFQGSFKWWKKYERQENEAA